MILSGWVGSAYSIQGDDVKICVPAAERISHFAQEVKIRRNGFGGSGVTGSKSGNGLPQAGSALLKLLIGTPAALLSGKVDAIYTQSKVFQHLQEDTGKIRMVEDLSRYPDWKLQIANTPAIITCTDVMAEEHPELVVAYMKSMIKVGRWANEHKRAAAVILDRQTFYRDAEDTYLGIKDVDMVPNLSPLNLACIKTGKDFMLKHGYIKNDFDVQQWAAPEFLEEAVKQLIEEKWKKTTTEKLPQASELQAESRRIG